VSIPIKLVEARQLFDAGEYEKALQLVSEIDTKSKIHGAAFLLRADANYELGNDIDALREYLSYVKHYPSGRAVDYCKFSAGICLKNLGLYEDAMYLFNMVQEITPSRHEELEHTKMKIKKQSEAKSIFQSCMLSS
jgi:tetratricopeptide (TPR) repeat protein